MSCLDCALGTASSVHCGHCVLRKVMFAVSSKYASASLRCDAQGWHACRSLSPCHLAKAGGIWKPLQVPRTQCVTAFNELLCTFPNPGCLCLTRLPLRYLTASTLFVLLFLHSICTTLKALHQAANPADALCILHGVSRSAATG